jgi:hypothetical protein
MAMAQIAICRDDRATGVATVASGCARSTRSTDACIPTNRVGPVMGADEYSSHSPETTARTADGRMGYSA